MEPPQQTGVAGFRLVRELGAGRFSRSWLAEDADARPYVLKLLRRYPADAEAVERFLEEAGRLVAAPELDHANVARPVAAGVHVDQLFLVYDSGGEATLADELRHRGRVVPGRALELCAQVCEGLAAAHRAGVLHRDLKPANVGLTRLADGSEQAVLLDVATSHLLAGIGLRDEGILPLSSAAYLSPEEAAGRPANARSDLYAAGVLLFQLISGRLPVMGATAEELLRAHRGQRPLRLRDAGSKVPDDLETLVSRLLAKDPAHRPATADELALTMRALAAISERAPEDDAPERVDDPLEPSDGEPPQMLPSAADPRAEQAMPGEAAPGDEPHSPAPTRKRFAFPRWTGPAAAAAGTLVAVVLALQLWRPASSDAQAPELAATSATPLPPAAEAVPSVAAPVPAEPGAPPEAAPSRWAKNFDRAQKALRTGHARSARNILRDVLGQRPLSRRDRARASKLMGDAEAKLGHRARAASWWRKSLQLYEDPQDRAVVSELLHPPR